MMGEPEGPVTDPDDPRLADEDSDGPAAHEPAADEPAADDPAADTADSAAPGLTDVTVNVDPDDGADHHPHSIQVASDATITLTWTGNENTTGVEIDGLGSFSASG